MTTTAAVCPRCTELLPADHNDWHTDWDGTDIHEQCCETYGPCWDPKKGLR